MYHPSLALSDRFNAVSALNSCEKIEMRAIYVARSSAEEPGRVGRRHVKDDVSGTLGVKGVDRVGGAGVGKGRQGGRVRGGREGEGDSVYVERVPQREIVNLSTLFKVKRVGRTSDVGRDARRVKVESS